MEVLAGCPLGYDSVWNETTTPGPAITPNSNLNQNTPDDQWGQLYKS